MRYLINSRQTLTERQWEFGHRTESRSLMPVIVPMYLREHVDIQISTNTYEHKSTNGLTMLMSMRII